MCERNYTDEALRVTRPVMRLAITGVFVRTDEQDRELQVEIATKISEVTGDRMMRLALDKIALRMNDRAVSDARFRALVREEVANALGILRRASESQVDPHRLLAGASS